MCRGWRWKEVVHCCLCWSEVTGDQYIWFDIRSVTCRAGAREGSKSNISCCALLARRVRATFAWYTRDTSYANFARNICVTYAPDSRRIHASHPRIRRKCCANLPSAQQGMLLFDPSVGLSETNICRLGSRQQMPKLHPLQCILRYILDILVNKTHQWFTWTIFCTYFTLRTEGDLFR
jgi:hypothetical protein